MKVCIVVPVYNCEPVIHSVVESLLSETTQDILIVDDGSQPALSLNCYSERLKLLRINKNSGKGAALQRAMRERMQSGYSHMLAFDGDGQHKAADVVNMVLSAEKNPKAIVIGCRRFDQSVPGISQFGRKFSNFWVNYQTGVKVGDSQSGLRVYPLSPLSDLKYFTKRYDFEIEVLVRGLWGGLKIHEIDVDVFYPPESERISHFHKIKDNARITALNIFLIAYSLVFFHKSLAKVLAVGVCSVFIAMIPSFVFSFFVAAFFCVIFRLNASLMLACLLFLRLI